MRVSFVLLVALFGVAGLIRPILGDTSAVVPVVEGELEDGLEVDLEDDLPEDQEIDARSLFEALFEADDDDEGEAVEKSSSRQSRVFLGRQASAGQQDAESTDMGVDAEGQGEAVYTAAQAEEEQDRAVSDPVTIAKTNGFVDVLFQKINAELRKGEEPLSINMSSKKRRLNGKLKSAKNKKSGNKNKKNKKSGNKTKKNNNRKSNRKNSNAAKKEGDSENIRGRNNRRRGANKKRSRHPKDLNLEELEAEDADEEVEAVEGEAEREKRSADDSGVESMDDTDEESEVSSRQSRARTFADMGLRSFLPGVEGRQQGTDVRTAFRNAQKAKKSQNRRIITRSPSKGGNKKNRKAGSKRKNNKNKKDNKRNKSKRGNKGKKSNKRSKSKKAKKSKKKARTSAVVTGFSSLARRGNVEITQKGNTQKIKSGFTMGPVTVVMQRKYGNAETKTARTTAATVTGELIIEVNNKGSAKLSKIKINAPAKSRVTGTLLRAGSKKSEQNKATRTLSTTIKKITPRITSRIKNKARDVLKSTSSAVRSKH